MESTIQLKTGITLNERITLAVATVLELIRAGHSIVLTLSSGKDSTTTTLLCLEAIRQAKLAGIRQATHYVSSSTTAVENPEIENSLLQMHEDIQQWVEAEQLPVELRFVHPNAAARFVVNIIGRGSLPRFVENGSAHRTCTADWKIAPQERLATEINNEVLGRGYRETVSVLGTRLDESVVRGSAMRKRGDQAQVPVRNPAGFLTLSLIADWTEGVVWDFLCTFLEGEVSPFPAFTHGGTVRRMLDLYRDANEGTCGMFLSDGKKSPCGSRFGCWTCTIIGDKDKSMESMLDSDPRYEYIRGLSNFRNFLVATQWDMTRRELVGRSISDAGYLPIRPDVYSLDMRRELLSYMLTLDELERERAEQLDADLITGKAPDTPENQRMRNPQFEHIGIEDICLIDFYWGMHHYASEAFPALRVWYEIKVLGRRWTIPKIPKAEAGKIAPKKWFKVSKFDAHVPTDGLRDYKAEQWNRYRHPDRPISHMETGGERVVWHEEAKSLQVDLTEALLFLDTFCQGALPIETQMLPAIESTRFWLNEGIVKMPKGMIAKYQHMAKRAQYFAHLVDWLNVVPAELDQYLQEHAISDSEHNVLLGIHEEMVRVSEDVQLDLWTV